MSMEVITTREQTTAEYWLRFCVEHNSKRGRVKLQCNKLLEIADTIEKLREKGQCKDCIHHASFIPWCKIFDKRMNDDDYCSRFERK